MHLNIITGIRWDSISCREKDCFQTSRFSPKTRVPTSNQKTSWIVIKRIQSFSTMACGRFQIIYANILLTVWYFYKIVFKSNHSMWKIHFLMYYNVHINMQRWKILCSYWKLSCHLWSSVINNVISNEKCTISEYIKWKFTFCKKKNNLRPMY